MGQYKVPQNVESEDKIIGPLTFKQFIYALIGIGWSIACIGILHDFLPIGIALAAPVSILFLLLAFYQRDGQNFEQLLVAMVGYFSQSRKRVWRKEELVETFKVTPHAAAEEQNQRSPAEVRSQLERLGEMIDSRGWNRPTETEFNPAVTLPDTDRLVAAQPAPSAASEAPANDMLDIKQGPLSQNLTELLNEAAEDVREEAIEQMSAPIVKPATPQVSASVTTQTPENILKLATDSDDISVSQLAANATRMAPLQNGQAVELRNG